jgi:poly(A) polymerase
VVPARFATVLDELRPLAARFAERGWRAYLVGGSVRDLVSGRESGEIDFDLTTDAPPDAIHEVVGPWADAVWTPGERFGTISCRKGDRTFEITTHRAEAYLPETRKPEVRFSPDVREDLSRRDFTINAMALDLTAADPELIAPHDGMTDLLGKVLRTPLSPQTSFSDDPLRMLRAARFIAVLGMTPDPALVDAARELAPRLSIVSAERIRTELDKLIVAERPSSGLWFLVDTGLADHFLPELPAMRLEQDPIHRHKDVLSHTFAVVENVQPNAHPSFDFRITRLAALMHDVGKPRTRAFAPDRGVTFHHHEVVGARMTKSRLREMRYPQADVDAITDLVELHLRFHTYQMGWTDAAVRRYVRDAGNLLNELNVLTRCDCTTRNEKKAKALSKRMDELEARIADLAAKEELAAMRPEMDGTQVMAHLGIPPGHDVGAAIEFLMEIRLEEGTVGDVEIRHRLDAWWASRTTAR